MRKYMGVACGVALAAMLAGCGGGSGLKRNRPDEFAVARQAPLVIPPDFSLTPPKPGAPRPQDNSPNVLALDALFGGAAVRSASEQGLLTSAGAESAQPGIRSEVSDPETNVVDKGTTTKDIVSAPEGNGRNASAKTPQ
ncbi:MAG: DUF3035 domain-containing protein [Sphingomonas sp.]